MKGAFLEGEQVILRPLRRTDLTERYLGWLNDPKVNKYLETGIFPQTDEALEEFYQGVALSHDNVVLAIADRQTGLHLGNVRLGPIHWVHRRATLGILIGESDRWNSGVGMEATQMILEYAFHRLGLHRIGLGVFAEHKAAIHVYEKCGFRQEGVFRQDLFHEGRFKDRLWYGLLREEWEKDQSDGKL